MKSYIVGFSLSIVLTLIPYILVVHQLAPKAVLFAAIFVAALLQLGVQLKYFLHLDFSAEGKSRLFSFAFTILILTILVAGSLWIMHDLNYFMMDPVMNEAGHFGH